MGTDRVASGSHDQMQERRAVCNSYSIILALVQGFDKAVCANPCLLNGIVISYTARARHMDSNWAFVSIE